MQVRLSRGQIGRVAGVDTTVKSARGVARQLALTWPMVLGVKRGELSHEEYARQYRAILDAAPLEVWRWLWRRGRANGGTLTVLCYCRAEWSCHTDLLIDYACERFPRGFARMEEGGSRGR